MPFENTPLRDSGAPDDSAHARKQRALESIFPIETDRLLIREIRPDDVDAFQELVSHSEFHYYYFDGSREKTQAFVDEAIATRTAPQKGELRKSFMMAVEHKITGTLIGHVTVDILDKAPDDYDLAYFIHPDHWGRGYATEAAAGFLKALFDTVAPPQVVATAHPENIASQKLLRHVGFKETGETTRIESADGKGERLWYRLDPQNFRGPKAP
jgi:[ribosomal protein S5]-alanine N-acetyltransferase